MDLPNQTVVYDALIVGAGPAGLSAALVLGRCRRRVLLCDHGRPRNAAALAVHGFLGCDGMSPRALRSLAREQLAPYDVTCFDVEVTAAERRSDPAGTTSFVVQFADGAMAVAKKLLIASGTTDCLPKIVGIREYYGRSIHHCPFCDGWEHRNRRLAAFGRGIRAASLAFELLAWSPQVSACTDGENMPPDEAARLQNCGVEIYTSRVVRLEGRDGLLTGLHFADGREISCDALFFSGPQVQQPSLPKMLGCHFDEHGLLRVEQRGHSGVEGVFLAGDVIGDIQFAVAAAADGAIAAATIHRELHRENMNAADSPPRNQDAAIRQTVAVPIGP